jgi:hypothetical protein
VATQQSEAASLTVDSVRSMQIADDLWIDWVVIAEVKEQDLNAQVMQPRHMDRLTENIRIRGMVESLPYCHQPGHEGPISVISGHHRMRAARAAGMLEMPALVDTRTMTRSEITAKQIAHNALVGESDDMILRTLVSQITNVDDLLTTGLDEEFLPTIGQDDTQLLIPHAEFDWRIVTLTFLPNRLEAWKEALDTIDRHSELVGVGPMDQMQGFAEAVHEYGQRFNIKSMATIIATLTEVARREIQAKIDAGEVGEDGESSD